MYVWYDLLCSLIVPTCPVFVSPVTDGDSIQYIRGCHNVIVGCLVASQQHHSGLYCKSDLLVKSMIVGLKFLLIT